MYLEKDPNISIKTINLILEATDPADFLISRGRSKKEFTSSKKKIERGKFYSFRYNSKLFDEGLLPHFDLNPVILCIGVNSKYVLGLNFNYLPTQIRKRVIERLKKIHKKWDKNTKVPNATWKGLKTPLRNSKHMVKLYLKSRISGVIQIKNIDMEKLATKRTDNFVGKTAKTIWKNLGL